MIDDGARERIRSSALATLEKHRDAKRKLKRKFTKAQLAAGTIAICLGVSFGFWIGGKVPISNAIAQSEVKPSQPPASSSGSDSPKILKVTLTIGDPSDLKVKQGDFVQVNQVISDRKEERDRLLLQKSEYESAVKRLSLEVPKPIEPLTIKKVPRLPEQSFAQTEASIDLQRLKIKAAEDRVSLQQKKLELISTLNARDLPPGVEAHEQQKLAELQAALKVEETNMQLELGKLETEKSGRSLKEYEAEQAEVRIALEQNRSLAEYQKSLAEYQRGEQERQFRIADLKQKIADVDNKLTELSVVKAQYAGEVKRIKYVSQTNNRMDVELLFRVADRGDRRIRPNSKGSEVAKPVWEPITKPNNSN
ncbi:hypothetical protein TUMEXPCC7403_25145 [Tumidithrix helvetica PCC 7403]